MKTSIIKTIFWKELKEVLRDKRMIFLIILLPFFMYPVLFFLIGSLGKSQQENMAKETVQVLLSPEAENTQVYPLLKDSPGLDVKLESFDRARLDTLKNTIGIQVASDFNQQVEANESATVEVFANESKELLEARQKQIVAQLNALKQSILQQRLDSASLSKSFVEPIVVKQTDLASREMRIGKAIGSFLPMILLLFIFMGAIYIGIDITTGEKERRTLQTLFTTPASIREIIAGKFLAVLLVAVTSAFMNLSSLVVAVMIQANLMSGGNMSNFSLAVTTGGWIWMTAIILLTAVFLSALCLAVVILANSYKEAQSYVSPLMMIVLIPAIMVQMPGIELNMTTACVPMLNICLSIKAIFQGAFPMGPVALTTAFIALYALLALFFASRVFGNENVVTGEKINFKQFFTS